MIEIAETAPLNSVQDLGRVGTRGLGVGPSGAMDTLALAAGNAMLGNAPGAAGIEVQMVPVRIRILATTTLALTGADCTARLDGRDLPPWWAFTARAGQELVLPAVAHGMRGYLTMGGGIDVPLVLGARSTSLRDGFGGLEGRALQPGDVLRPCAGTWGGAGPLAGKAAAGFGVEPPHSGVGELELRVVPAAEHDQFDDASRAGFWASAWTVTAQGNRQGYQLAGPVLRRTDPLEMRSHPILPGTIQVPPSGQPVIQLADANSAGGYPKIGVVIGPDVWRLAQAAPGRRLRFVACTVAQARAAELANRAYLARIGRLSALLRGGEPPDGPAA